MTGEKGSSTSIDGSEPSSPFEPAGKQRSIFGSITPFTGIDLNYAVIESGRPGPCVLITAGVHGSESCGIETARRLMRMPAEQLEKGMLIVFPVLSVQAMKQRSIFVMPEDGKNLNHQFPGKPDGSVSERLAHWLVTEIYPKADLYMDLHSGDLTEELTPFTLFADGDPQAKELSKIFALPFACQVARGAGFTLTGAVAAEIPAIIVEVGGGSRWNEGEVGQAIEGVGRVLHHHGMISSAAKKIDEVSNASTAAGASNLSTFRSLIAPENAAEPKYITGKAIKAQFEGYWIGNKRAGNTVVQGERLGEIQDINGGVICSITSDTAAIYLMGSTALWIGKGEMLAVLATPF